jgi:hypothetical protein
MKSIRILWALAVLAVWVPVCLNAQPSADDPTMQDYTLIDAHARKTPKVETATIERLSEYLASAAQNDFERARAAFTWIAVNVAYDTDIFRGGTPITDWEGALKKRKAVCDGYANLLVEMLDNMGIEAHVVQGHGRQLTEAPTDKPKVNHSWVYALLAGSPHLIDPTWGAGVVNGGSFVYRYNDFYFCTPPELMILNHFPEDPKDQLLADPYTTKQFQNSPNFSLKGASYLFSPREDRLKIGKEVLFKLRIPNAKSVKLVLGKTNINFVRTADDLWELKYKPIALNISLAVEFADAKPGAFDVLAIWHPVK